jgi:3-oxoadipate enol-lactonase
MPSCRGKEIDLYYEIHGEGPTLLFVAGLGGGTWSWYGQVPYFRERYRTVIFDNRGAGRSSMPPGPYQMKEFAEDARCLLDHLGVEKAFLIGLSMGGMIAQELALMVPHRIQAIVLGCTHGGGSLRVPPAPRVMEVLLNNDGLTQKEIIEKNVPLFFSEACRKERPDVIADYCAAQLSTPEQPAYAFHAQLAAIGSFDAGTRLMQLDIPALIVTGSEDVLIPPENSKSLAARIPHAEMVVIPGAGHALHAECREKLNRLADEFFRRHLAGGSRQEIP